MRRRGYVPLRCRGDVLIERCCYVLLRLPHVVPIRRHGGVTLRRLGDVPLRRPSVLHLRRAYDVTGTYRETSLRQRHDILLPDGMVNSSKDGILLQFKKWA